MPTLRDRIDFASITATFLPLPKGRKRGAGVGFCAGEPIASVEGAGHSAPPYRWAGGIAEPITFPDVKKLGANGTSVSQIAGLWSTPKGDERALVWTRNGGVLTGAELHPETWEKSTGMACGGGQQVGFGYEKFVNNPSKALLWTGTRESMVVLTGSDPTRDAMGMGVADGVQVGYVGGSGRQRACLWKGTTESHLDLHPSAESLVGSEALGVGDGQQVGQTWDGEMMSHAALWTGSADSWVNLSPGGFPRSRASACARGLQVGWACRQERGMLLRAMLWNGSADQVIDLQEFLPTPWNASWAVHLDVDGDRLRILGTAQRAVLQGGYEMDAGKVPVMWEMKLLIAEPRRADLPAAVGTASDAVTRTGKTVELSTENRVEKVAADFARAIIDDNFKAAHNLLAPWLQMQVTAKKLQNIFKKQFIDDVAPADFAISGNNAQLNELREHYQEYHGDDVPKTLATAKEFGAWGPPSIHIADEITADNFRQWLSLEFTPEAEHASGLDYCLRLWLIVVDVDGVMTVGHLEPGE
jgi:hypothetical protein